MDNIVKLVTEKAGISESQAKSAVDTVISFLKDKMPGGIGSQVEGFLNSNAGTIGNVVDTAKDKLGDMFGK